MRVWALAGLRIELPAERELQRLVRATLHGFFQDLYARVIARFCRKFWCVDVLR